ncbi:hypothetical protein [Salipaludibacillus sp. CF4.18]
MNKVKILTYERKAIGQVVRIQSNYTFLSHFQVLEENKERDSNSEA